MTQFLLNNDVSIGGVLFSTVPDNQKSKMVKATLFEEIYLKKDPFADTNNYGFTWRSLH